MASEGFEDWAAQLVNLVKSFPYVFKHGLKRMYC